MLTNEPGLARHFLHIALGGFAVLVAILVAVAFA
jgi:hypothetical protein